MKKLRLKKSVIVVIYILAVALIGTSAYFVSENMKDEAPTKTENTDYVNESVIDENPNEDVEVINEIPKMGKPYLEEKTTIAKNFYDYQADKEQQQKSILYHEGTYIQNSGIDFTVDGKTAFDVVSVLSGTVIDVKEDELLGKIVEIKHDDDFVSSYQCLGEVSVKKNDVVNQGQTIGKSGTNKIDKEIGNHLHFELYKAGEVVNPNQYFDKEITSDATKDKNDTTENSDTTNNGQTNNE